MREELSSERKRELLAELLKAKAREEKTTGPLSYGQRALWFVYQLDKQSAAYNIMYAARVREDVDRDALTRSFQKIIDRHAVLRTTYGSQNGLPVQVVAAYHEFQLTEIDARQWDDARLQAELQAESDRPFDLETGPVIRVFLFRRQGPQVLLITAHHIAIDFWSFDLLFDELEALYRQEVTGTAAELPAPEVQYTDFVAGRTTCSPGAHGDRLWEYLARPAAAVRCPIWICPPIGLARRSRRFAATRIISSCRTNCRGG